jgi:hypothetical protein
MIDFSTLWMKQNYWTKQGTAVAISMATLHMPAPMEAYQHGDRQGLGEVVDKTNTPFLDLPVLAYN